MFKSIGKTNIGLKRKVNQDFFMIGNIVNASWAIVCDGLGGAKAGDIASKRATEIINNHLNTTYHPKMTKEDIKNMLVMACNLANVEIFDMGRANIDYEGMATTAIVSLIVGNQLHIAHVGDSRIYLLNTDGTKQLTKDDSFVQALVEQGTLSVDEAKKHPQRNYLTKAIGVEKDIEIYYECFNISNSDKVLMCTDGLYNYLDDDVFLNVLGVTDIDFLLNKFIKLALDGGGSDNITVVIMFDEDNNSESRVK